jgi:hypothetical protein
MTTVSDPEWPGSAADVPVAARAAADALEENNFCSLFLQMNWTD